MKSPDKELIMTFQSIPAAKEEDGWKVRLSFPASATASTKLTLSAVDGAGAPVAEGEFRFMGATVRISGGSGTLLYADFIKGIHEPQVWMIRPGCVPLPGGLTFE